jgi:protein-tyrosine phosphatase
MGFVDLHAHWVAGIDDGAKTPEQGAAMLAAMARLGFEVSVATPHMRPGMFDNTADGLRDAFARMAPHLPAGAPQVHLSSEHWLDDVVFQRLTSGQALPYPGGRAALIEWTPQALPMRVEARLFDLRRRGIVPVIAHPERYQPVWEDPDCVDAWLDVGACLLLDVCSITGKYGRTCQKTALRLLEDDAYEAACTDAHKPEDLDDVARALDKLAERFGAEERDRLFADGPRAILAGDVG